jgi:ribose transport system ATP-binding protein
MINQPIVSIKNVGKQFAAIKALDEVSFDVRSGELVAICGENGAGKSTLMKILSGVYTEYDGSIEIDGQPVRFRSTKDAEEAGVSIIHQELNLVEQLSVAANIFLGRELTVGKFFRNDRLMREKANQLLRELECNVDAGELAGSLRVGDQQLVEIAKALSLQARILVMDEPTSALTESEVERLYRVIAKLRQRGTTILYISHKMDEVFHLSDRVVVLRDGQFIAQRDTSSLTPAAVTQLMVGRELESIDLGSKTNKGEKLLEVRSLTLPWPGHARGYRLKDIHFDLHAGEVLGIAGLMGAGRTELLECLFGANTIPASGEIYLQGRIISPRHPREAIDHGIALVTEDRKRLGIFTAMSVGQNITLCDLASMTNAGLLSVGKQRSAAVSMVDKLKIKSAGLSPSILSLSGGNQQKCIVGRWLLTRPRVLLLDDPTRGVDVGAKAELYRIIRQLCNEGLGVIVTSSELPELLTLSDRIMVLSEGRQAALFNRDEATQDRIIQAATGMVERV